MTRPSGHLRRLTGAVLAMVGLAGCSLIIQFEDKDPVCGNGKAEHGEECDGQDVRGVDCESEGLHPGTVTCTTGCALDFQACGGYCGDGHHQQNTTEQCDGSDFSGATCQDENYSWTEGSLTCDQDCKVIHDHCWGCGDGVIENDEECEREVPIEQTCGDQGFDGGEMDCAECRLRTHFCWNCGDQSCNRSYGETFADCPQDCGWRSVDVGWTHGCGANMDGRVYCWGFNDVGQLGLDPATQGGVHGRPVSVLNLVPLSDEPDRVATGDGFTVVDTQWNLYTWGRNDRGQLGRDTTEPWIPGTISASISFSDIPTGLRAGRSFACLFSSSAETFCWGDNTYGQLGRGGTPGTPAYSALPQQVQGISITGELALGADFACALHDDVVQCWGRGEDGQLGDGQSTHSAAPVIVAGLPTSSLSSLTAGKAHACVVHHMWPAELWCWGDNSHGQFGAATPLATDVPVNLGPVTGGFLSPLSAGGDTTCSGNSTDHIHCWGDNTWSQAGGPGSCGAGGDLIVPSSLSVPDASPLANWVQHAAGDATHCVYFSYGPAFCWGLNDLGQVGNGGAQACYATPQLLAP